MSGGDSVMMSNQARLVYMANQIARNLEGTGHDDAAKAVADHIASFWDPRMRAQISALQEAGDAGLSPAADAAITLLRERGAPPPQSRATLFNSVDGAGHSDAG
ncbi:formate dehydrogenase subunit delta [Sphingomonadales bacterium 56]|uniref:formate dehydrogenase subunit delta n=1 Tax=unclassified Sphingobium TaxID=2611147 RepID=UPI0019190947|nr:MULTISPECIES: formate dehydrogenase subunit delta [unclassified Sphingobium]MBY2929788.1 formate dehydrogenase subunit delta [Sphingomonadales bacterium 56]MBY2960029.1 formate dehydrogenase subunit delta [Sphingomonadales bacterium 58]CAD7340132.1 hypothetical protein SPHS6_02830 [Sphingobium sp. S6]CAD7340292.1 hypothetical protein SPHS8_03003 [Sphingobium sp. S8]